MKRSSNVCVIMVATIITTLSGCKDSPTAPEKLIHKIDTVSPVDLTAVVHTVVDPAPAVRVTDSDGHPAANVDVSFTVTGGFGSTVPSHAITDSDGRASVAWTLGTGVGIQTLTARAGTLEPVVFTAKAIAGPPSLLERNGVSIQMASVGSVASSAVSVRVLDGFRNPVGGVSVSFTVTAGGGAIEHSDGVTDSTGTVTVGKWTLGPVDGVQTLRAQAGGMSVIFSVDTYDCAGITGIACTGLGELIFVRNTDGYIYRIRADGTNLLRLTNDAHNNYAPKWSPDGRRIAFIRYTPPPNNNGPGASDIFIMNADGSNLVRRTTNGNYYAVVWSPDGRKLTAAAYVGDYSNLYVMSTEDDGSPVVTLVTDGASPSWSPDGNKIFYIHGTGYYDSGQIYVIGADGSDAHPLIQLNGSVWGAALSPDGKKIAYMQCSQACSTYIMNADGSQPTVVDPISNMQDIAWSPNGKWLAVTIWGNTAPSISYVPIEGGELRAVASGAMQPSWRPPTP